MNEWESGLKNQFLIQLKTILDANRIHTDPDIIARHCVDYNALNKGQALAVIFPDTAEEIASIIKICRQNQVIIVPQGGNTSDYGGSVPDSSGNSIILNMSRMNRIIDVDLGNNTALVEAGVILGELNDHLATFDRWFPITLGSQGSCQIGGNIAMNSGGNTVLRYGMVRENTMGIECVFGNGQIFSNLRGLRKQCIGYDLGQLLIGSEGTLGIVTKAVLKLQPLPRAISTAWIAVTSLESALEMLNHVLSSAADKILAFEVISQFQRDIIVNFNKGLRDPIPEDHDWFILLEFGSPTNENNLQEFMESLLALALEDSLILDAVIASNETQRKSFWMLRESVLDANKAYGWPITHDASVPVSKLPSFANQVEQKIGAIFPDARFLAAGHAGDGNIHLGVIFEKSKFSNLEEYKAATHRVNEVVFDIAHSLGGHFSSEHGIGIKHIRSFNKYTPSSNIELMKNMKLLLDPDNIMNPGKIFG